MVRSSSDFHQAVNTRARGTAAEEAAARWLTHQGYRIRQRNYRIKAGEIDILAIEDGTLCFVEVKARSGRGYGPGSAAVTHAKQRRIARVAAIYLASSGWQGPCRFDVLSAESARGGSWRFRLIRDAFRSEK